ncbi:MAG TPA: ABC transporter ATP-binding protein [Gemmataceae bacterium]|nr:ABC transporter ATP-binding protein [Gemmataceae bacterium]
MIAEASANLAIELNGVTRRFGKATAVDDLTLRIPQGHTFGLIGPNGAGKSTTIKLLMGILRPQVGYVRILGIDVFAEPSRMKKRVGYVPEVPQMYRWMRVGELIGFCRAFYPTWNDDECARLLDLFALDTGKKVRHLSKGMAAKLSLVLALAHDPEVLILDEPTSGLDPLVREEFLDGVLGAVCKHQRTVLFSSHALEDVHRLADTVGLLYEGRLLLHRGVEELLTSARRIRAVLRDGCLPRYEPPGLVWQHIERREWMLTVSEFTPDLLQTLRKENDLEHLEVMGLNLEELFKDFVKGRKKTT